MNEKEKAKELVMKFQYLVTGWDCYHDEPIELIHRLSDMKKCALICVEQVIASCFHPNLEYWQEVKQEINKL